jgi:aromatic ring-opening dioxygenase catalytic subunit (LigB family)
MIFDYYGFPQHTYELKFPAPGAPELAGRIVELIRAEGLPARTDAQRGFDHGVFIPFLLVTPEADIPVVPLSLRRDLDPEAHLRVGRALARVAGGGPRPSWNALVSPRVTMAPITRPGGDGPGSTHAAGDPPPV